MRSSYIDHYRVRQRIKRIGPLGLVILLHLAFFYVLQSGLIHQVVSSLPKEVIVSFITPERAPIPVPTKAPAAPPKVVHVVKKTVVPTPPLPVTQAPAPTAIAAPPAPPQPAEPAPPAAAPKAAPASPPTPAQPKQVSTGIEYIREPQPNYPLVSKRRGEEGNVKFRVLVNTEGQPERVEILKGSGFPRLDDAARTAVMGALFKPYMEDGKPLSVWTVGSLNYVLH